MILPFWEAPLVVWGIPQKRGCIAIKSPFRALFPFARQDVGVGHLVRRFRPPSHHFHSAAAGDRRGYSWDRLGTSCRSACPRQTFAAAPLPRPAETGLGPTSLQLGLSGLWPPTVASASSRLRLGSTAPRKGRRFEARRRMCGDRTGGERKHEQTRALCLHGQYLSLARW